LEEKVARISESLEKSVQPLTPESIPVTISSESIVDEPASQAPVPKIVEDPLSNLQSISSHISLESKRDSIPTTADIAQKETEIQDLIDVIDKSVHEAATPVPVTENLPTAAEVNATDVERILEQLAGETAKTAELEQAIRELEATKAEAISTLQQEVDELKEQLAVYQAKAKKLGEETIHLKEEIVRKNNLIKGKSSKFRSVSCGLR
jgi:DNA repair exonuclease SbcCD ATPase subunit